MTVTMDENGPMARPEGEEVSGPWRATRYCFENIIVDRNFTVCLGVLS